MRKVFLLSLLLITVNSILLCQSAKFPYPIIFVHGLNSSAETWREIANQFGGDLKVFDFCLNHDGINETALLQNDTSSVGWRDIDGNIINNISHSENGIYAINFDNEHFASSGHSSHFLSNQAAIYKQGCALSVMIRKVLALESGVSKVILFGHSMGGLAIREYLQRTNDGTNNSNHTWWINQTDSGHKVARVITIGTPHLGSNAWADVAELFGTGIDSKSEAVRDLRYSVPRAIIQGGSFPALYLFSGNESDIPDNLYYNKDINCDETENSSIIGLNEGTKDNHNMMLPINLKYTWITSDYLIGGGDIVVDLSRQWLYSDSNEPLPTNITDTLLTNKFHIDEPSDYYSIIRGLDEPDISSLAYEIKPSCNLKGYITYQTNNNPLDKDLYKVVLNTDCCLTINIGGGSSTGVGVIELLDGQEIYKDGISYPDNNGFSYACTAGTYFIQVIGVASNESNKETYLHPYTLSLLQLQLTVPNFNTTYQVGSSMNIEWASTNISNVKLELTIDGGVNWTTIISSTPAAAGSFAWGWGVPNTPSSNCKIRISDASNPSDFDVSDYSFTISNSTEATWSAQSSGTTNNLYGVSFINHNNGTAVSLFGEIVHTTNGGSNWSLQSSGTTAWLSSVSYPATNKIAAVGLLAILSTTDGGSNWLQQTRVNNSWLHGVSFIDNNIGFAVGEDGTIIKTTNSGADWLAQTSGTADTLRGVSFTDYNYGSVVGSGGVILRTTNGGTNWISQTSGTIIRLNAVSFTDVNNGTAVGGSGTINRRGANGIILRTTNGGSNWSIQVSDYPNSLWGVSFTDANNGTVVGENGTILRTTNGGTSWSSQTSGTTNSLYAVSFTDANTGTVVGENGTILRTTNGALPVELTLFNGQRSGNNIRLNWKTETEIKNYGFEIERKTNNTSWRKIGFISGYGNSNSPKEYNFVDSDILNDKVLYRLKQIDFDGKYEYSKEIVVNIEAPKIFSLSQNFPNPFNPSTKIKYSISTTCFVRLNIYDILGRELLTLVNEQKLPGTYENIFNGLQYPSGIYFYELQAGTYSERKRFILMK